MKHPTKRALATAVALILIFTCLFTACGKKGDSSSKQPAISSSTTQAAETKPADPLALTKADFSYGGRNVNGYTNYVDCIEKSGRTRSYWFTDESSYCKKANRGLNIGDELSSWSKVGNDTFCEDDKPNAIFKQYGKAEIQDTGENEFYQLFHPEIASPEDDDAGLYQLDFQKKLIYSFSYHGRTYYKTFYYYVDHHYGMPYLEGVVYSIK